ncbi:MAG: MarR family transcriptional regulator [Actinobacteria bacterium]|nr:MarR family transcriptional regulator [Actinomycetota bacterium]
MTSSGERVAAQLGRLLLRSTRQHLYRRVTHGITGVDVTTYPVLSGVDRLGPTTATRLALAIGLDRSATTRYASKLEEAGLIERRADPGDGRATQLTLTAAGIAAVARMRAELGVAVGEILSGWDEAEASAFADALRRFTDQLTGPSDPPED